MRSRLVQRIAAVSARVPSCQRFTSPNSNVSSSKANREIPISDLLRNFDGAAAVHHLLSWFAGNHHLDVPARMPRRYNEAADKCLDNGAIASIRGGGSTNFRLRGRLCGLEPDQCYWIAHEAQLRGLKKIDRRRDPPPDLIVDIAQVRGCVPRLPIYAALECRKYGESVRGGLSFHVLQQDGKYARAPVSQCAAAVETGRPRTVFSLANQLDETSLS